MVFSQPITSANHPNGVTDRNRDACLMHVYTNILFVIPLVLLSVGSEPTPTAYAERGALFYNALTPTLQLLLKRICCKRAGADLVG